MQLTELKDDIFQRWVAAFGEMDRIAAAKAAVVRYVYARGKCYEVENYDGQKIVPDEEVFSEPSEDTGYKYGLDKEGRPCYLFYEHKHNRVTWEGFFLYGERDTCYFEFNLNEQKPVAVNRLYLENDRKAGFQSCVINGGQLGNVLNKLTPEKILSQLEQTHSLLLVVEQYCYEQGHIATVECLSIMPGVGEHLFERKYAYDEQGDLQEKYRIDDDGNVMFDYVKFPEGRTLEEVAEELSLQIAASVVVRLTEKGVKDPLGMIELNYREVDNYWPVLKIQTSRELQQLAEGLEGDDLLDAVFFSDGEYITVPGTEHARLLAAFTQEILRCERYNVATDMMRRVAVILTDSRLFDKVPLDDHFFVYAVDWSMNDEDIAAMVRACGMSDETLAYWRSRGLFMYDE